MIYAENILICIAVPILIACAFTRGDNRRMLASFVIGMGVCLLSAYISGFINAAGHMDTRETAIYISPFIEEMMKLMPLLFYFYMFEPDDDALIFFAIGIGTGFSVYENCCYILTEGAESISYILIRGLAVGVMHIMSILLLALGMTIVRRFGAMSVAGIIGALALSMTFHGLYNLLVSENGISSYIGYVMPMFVAVLLWRPYRRLRDMSE